VKTGIEDPDLFFPRRGAFLFLRPRLPRQQPSQPGYFSGAAGYIGVFYSLYLIRNGRKNHRRRPERKKDCFFSFLPDSSKAFISAIKGLAFLIPFGFYLFFHGLYPL